MIQEQTCFNLNMHFKYMVFGNVATECNQFCVPVNVADQLDSEVGVNGCRNHVKDITK